MTEFLPKLRSEVGIISASFNKNAPPELFACRTLEITLPEDAIAYEQFTESPMAFGLHNVKL